MNDLFASLQGINMSPTLTPTQCEGCSSKFSWLRKRRTCLLCRSVCCSSCMQRLRLCGVGRECQRCARLAGVRYERAALQQMTVRDLKHIMKILSVSSATCREKSDLVDAILMARESAGQPSTPSVRATPAAPAPAPAPASTSAAPRSYRVGPYESIRVRAMDESSESESCRPVKPPNVSRVSGSSSSSPSDCDWEENEEGFVLVDVETTDDAPPGGDAAVVRPVEVEDPVDRPVDVEGDRPVDVEVDRPGDADAERPVDVEVGSPPVDAEATVDVSRHVEVTDGSDDGDDGDDDGDELVVVDDDPDEPQSESVAIEVDKEDDNADDPMSQTDVDLSRLTDVAQIPSEDLISRLTVRQCKRLLLHRRTDYRDVIEKEELLRRVRELWRETKRNAEALSSATDRDICKICMDSLVDCVMLECGHMATCTACGKQMSECPICRKYVVRVVHVFRS